MKEFIRKNGEVTKKDLKLLMELRFHDGPDHGKMQDIITIDYNTYMHSDRLNITRKIISIFIGLSLQRDTVSCRKVYGVIRKESFGFYKKIVLQLKKLMVY